jgi:hypothetical protein
MSGEITEEFDYNMSLFFLFFGGNESSLDQMFFATRSRRMLKVGELWSLWREGSKPCVKAERSVIFEKVVKC